MNIEMMQIKLYVVTVTRLHNADQVASPVEIIAAAMGSSASRTTDGALISS